MKIAYISFKLDNPRDQITLRGLRENNISTVEISERQPGFKKYINFYKKYRAVQNECDLIMIGYASSALVVFFRLFTTKKIVYNALATFYDSMIMSRLGGSFLSFSAIWHYLIDFFAFRMANLSFLECQIQKDLVVKVFGIKPEKISVQFVGTDDKQFYFDPSIKKLNKFTVVFRGAFLPEAGADVVVRAAKELEDKNINVRLLGRGFLLKEIKSLIEELKPKNLEVITELLPIDDLRKKMLECHVSLGQLANHPRAQTTVPHKVFESMSMKLAYITGENRGVLEIVQNGQTCFTIPPGDSHALAQKILELRDNPREIERVAENAYELFKNDYTPKVLAEKVIRKISIAPL